MNPYQSPTYGRVRDACKNLIKEWADQGLVQLKKELSIHTVQNQVFYALETNFLSSQNKTASKTYSYTLIKNQQGEVMASAWKTPPKERPGSIWIPSRDPLNQGPLKDLFEAAEHCQNRNHSQTTALAVKPNPQPIPAASR